MNIVQKLNQPDEAPLHSNAFGEVAGAGGSAVGDVGLSIKDRQQLEINRRYVATYKQSTLGTNYIPPELRRYEPRAGAELRVNKRPGASRQAMNASVTQIIVPKRTGNLAHRHFVEPSARQYNPYA